MNDASRPPLVYKAVNKVRFVTAASLFDGHDASINIMRRILQATGCEVVHLGHNRSVEEIVNCALQEDAHGIAVTPRGSGTGLSGAAIPVEGGIVISFERMNAVLEIDDENHTAVVQPGVTLEELDRELEAHGLVYPVFPGEYSASLGGNVATNAGGMRAVKYGVTRHQVLGLEAVLANGDVIRTGGKFVKATTGYDLTQLIIGSEGTLAVATGSKVPPAHCVEQFGTELPVFESMGQLQVAPSSVHGTVTRCAWTERPLAQLPRLPVTRTRSLAETS